MPDGLPVEEMVSSLSGHVAKKVQSSGLCCYCNGGGMVGGRLEIRLQAPVKVLALFRYKWGIQRWLSQERQCS